MASIRQDINVGLIAFVGAVGSLVLLIIVLGVQAWFGYETDVIRNVRYSGDFNYEWTRHKAEQYANIGDTVGNGTVYAGPVPPPTGFAAADGYRWADEGRTQAAMPIHAAMAAFINAHGGNATAEQLVAADRGYVRLRDETYADPQGYVGSTP